MTYDATMTIETIARADADHAIAIGATRTCTEPLRGYWPALDERLGRESTSAERGDYRRAYAARIQASAPAASGSSRLVGLVTRSTAEWLGRASTVWTGLPLPEALRAWADEHVGRSALYLAVMDDGPHTAIPVPRRLLAYALAAEIELLRAGIGQDVDPWRARHVDDEEAGRLIAGYGDVAAHARLELGGVREAAS